MAKYVCFQRHSRFGTQFSTVVLCFHRHPRIGCSFLRILFSFPFQAQTYCPWQSKNPSGLFVALDMSLRGA